MNQSEIDEIAANFDEVMLSTDPNYDPNKEREVYLQEMRSAGYVIVLPEPQQLLIDLDTLEQREHFKKQFGVLRREFSGYVLGFKMTPSKSKPDGRHVTIDMPFSLTPYERVAWQAALGSDPMRELLSLIRLRRGEDNATLFIEKPEVAPVNNIQQGPL